MAELLRRETVELTPPTQSIWARPNDSDCLSGSNNRNRECGHPIRPPPAEQPVGQEAKKCKDSKSSSYGAQRRVAHQGVTAQQPPRLVFGPPQGSENDSRDPG